MTGKGVKDEAETHRLGGGSVGDVVFPGGQRQGRLVELHKDREHRLASAAFWACLSCNICCSNKDQKKDLCFDGFKSIILDNSGKS